MEKILILAGTIASMGVMVFIGYFLAYLFTETKLRLPFNFKPFNCCPCLSFWLSLGLNVFLTEILVSCFAFKGIIYPEDCIIVAWMFRIISLFMSLTAFFIIKNRYKIYE